jgi:hypothetical protein
MFVLTVDQDASTRRGDLVPKLLEHITPVTARLPGVLRPFERTVGDEVQAVVEDADDVVTTVLDLLRLEGWSVGVGAGPVDLPLPTSSRAASGPAFVRARAAVERAKGRGSAVPLAVDAGEGPGAPSAAEAEAVLRLLGGVISRRTDAGWEVVDLLGEPGVRQKDVAARLGISEQAVSQRLRTALWSEELAVRPVAARLLAEGDR